MRRWRLIRRRRQEFGWAVQRNWDGVGIAALAGVAAVGIALLLHQTHALDGLELKSVDARFALRGSREPSSAIVIVGIDPQTFSRLQLQWPFPRSLHARVIDRLKRDGAKAIVYDVQFTEPTTPASGTRSARQPAIGQDNLLIDAVRHAGNVVLATSEVGAHGENQIFGGAGVLARVGARAGAAIFPADSDGVNRRMLFSYRGLPTLGVVGAEVASGQALAASWLGAGIAWIDFAGPAGTMPEVSFASVLRDEVSPSVFTGKTVVVGATASNLQDVHATPFGDSGLMSGPELTANAIATAENGLPLRSSSGYVAVLLIMAFGLCAPFAGLRFQPVWVLAGSSAIGVVYALVVQVAFQAGSIVPLCDPLVALVLGCVGAVVADSLGERRRLQALKRALGPLRGEGSQFFISYRRSQSQWPAKILNHALVERFGSSSVFMDMTAIDAGDIWPREIEEASAGCSVMLVLIGPSWLEVRKPDGTRRLDDPQDWVRREVKAGLEHADSVVVPVLHDGAVMPSRNDLPDPLKPLVECHAISFTGEDLDTEVDRLIASVQSGRIRGKLRYQSRSIRSQA
jgi:CHASE2 domain-containing sensor protein